jgi:hypothetical protein
MSLTLTKLSETASTITLGWAPVPGAVGYRFTAEQQAKPSHTWDPTRTSVRFSKGSAWYKVEALGVEEEGEYPTATPPPSSGSKLRYWPPALASPVAFDLTNASRGNGFLRNGQGRDLRITCREVLTGPVDEIIGWRNVVWIGGEIASDSTGERGHIVPRDIQGTFHLEGIKGVALRGADMIAGRWGGANSVVQVQNCNLAVSHGGTSAHADVFQTQELRCASLRFDRCTFFSDYQGLFLSNEPDSHPDPSFQSQVSEMRMSHVNWKGNAIWLFKAIPSRTGLLPGPWYLEDVWAPNTRVYPTTAFVDWQGRSYPYGCFVEQDAQGQYVRWSTTADRTPSGGQAADCEIRGLLRIGPPADFAAADAGMGYVSPGYV